MISLRKSHGPMDRVNVNIQEGWMMRSGWRGRLVTIYRHVYSGAAEKSGREHNHPWKLAVSLVVRGGYDEILNGNDKQRRAFSIHWYRNSDHHRLVSVQGGTVTFFLGLCRAQEAAPCYSEITRHGAAHYSELRSVASTDVPVNRQEAANDG